MHADNYFRTLRLLLFLGCFYLYLFIYFGYRDTLVNTCTQYESKLYGFNYMIRADSCHLSLCQKLPLDPSMTNDVTSRRQHALQMIYEVMGFISMTV